MNRLAEHAAALPTTDSVESWGRYPRARHVIVPLGWRSEPLVVPPGLTALPYGLGRSYGDSCLNDGGALLLTRGLSRLIAFDPSSGVVRCESGVTLEELLRLVVPHGWFLPVTPGTQFVTLGGAIANDVHGKNHHVAGTLGRFVRRFELLRSTGERFECSPDERGDWFGATIGGLGLTGVITWAELQLSPIHNPYVWVESIRYDNLEQFFELNAESERDYPYTVSWVDCLARGRRLGRGVYQRGHHAAPQFGPVPPVPASRGPNVPLDLPRFTLNALSMRAFNFAVYWRQRGRRVESVMPYRPFFYPLDAIGRWNRIYGRRGFFQYQCVVPHGPDAIREVLSVIAASGQGSFLSVLKTFGALRSPGLLSFPQPGVTLALDFPNRGARTLALLERLDEIVRGCGGRVYPAKDSRMSPESFRAYFPQWGQLTPFVDPAFSSSFWRRVTQVG